MDKYIIFLFLTCLFQLSSQSYEKKYIAAVVECHAYPDTDSNVLWYENIIWAAVRSFHSDIVIFPEKTLTVTSEFACLVPDPQHRIVPYKNETYKNFEVMQQISKIAAENKAYIVINLLERDNCTKGKEGCPEKGYFLYNTNVAFDRNGTVIARYRKINIYGEGIDKPQRQELSTFTTDFGVTFGMFTCFDILFQTPGIDLVEKRKVKDIIFTSHWYGELPFLTAAQIQGGWSYAMNVTLLASGANNPKQGTTGTGIYFDRRSSYHSMYEHAGSAFYWWDMSKIPNSTESLRDENLSSGTRKLELLQDPTLPSAKKETLDFKRTNFKRTLCHNGLCCVFDISYATLTENNPDDYTYSAVVFQGERRFGKNFRHDVAYCAVVLCVRGNCAQKPSNGDFPLMFQKMRIEAVFTTKNTLQMPSTLTWKSQEDGIKLLSLMDYNLFRFEKKEISGGVKSLVSMEIKSKTVKNLITFGIYGRKFD